MNEVNIYLDVGGTFTKGIAYLDQEGTSPAGISYYETHSDQSKDEILDNFIYIISDLMSSVLIDNPVLSCIGMAFPGPFDYEKGVCLLSGLGKFESLYNVNIKLEILDRLSSNKEIETKEEVRIFFLNDAQSFALGEFSSSGKVKKGCYITLGTGCGSTFIENGIEVAGIEGIPESGMIFNEPFKNGKIDDYLSARGLNRIVDELFLEPIKLEDLSLQARMGVYDANQAFSIFGKWIGQALYPYLESFQPDELVFGGQISKSFPWFEGALRDALKIDRFKCAIRVTKDTSISTIKGLMYSVTKNKVTTSEDAE